MELEILEIFILNDKYLGSPGPFSMRSIYYKQQQKIILRNWVLVG